MRISVIKEEEEEEREGSTIKASAFAITGNTTPSSSDEDTVLAQTGAPGDRRRHRHGRRSPRLVEQSQVGPSQIPQ